MARLTVEDCEYIVPNRFNLVVMAATRSRDINNGAPISVDPDGDKVSVISLREIAVESIDVNDLEEQSIRRFQNPRNLSEADSMALGTSQEEKETDPEALPNASESFASIEQCSLESDFDSVSDILNADFDDTTS